ncbi:MotA/TolQ/ExbB proton channel family protein [Stieleria sp. JC731]|uniref:MotA/TolQ/ExbB proton channel family protein n=1 Tax=Pirellulaceae TaxID=2691357 RepID=UPI001E4201C1|nr:MotA/TolQ/ExbB proton channel family protein [Stieleria sp. JC731]MCC9600732.1 MotA/TolQ/ExbB proton channel family protein [Stieleria sp. JC731]
MNQLLTAPFAAYAGLSIAILAALAWVWLYKESIRAAFFAILEMPRAFSSSLPLKESLWFIPFVAVAIGISLFAVGKGAMWLGSMWDWLSAIPATVQIAAVALVYVLTISILWRYKFHTKIDGSFDPNRFDNPINYLPTGTLVHAVLLCIAIAAAVSLYERIDRKLNNSIVANCNQVFDRLKKNSRTNMEKRLVNVLEAFAPFLQLPDGSATVSSAGQALKKLKGSESISGSFDKLSALTEKAAFKMIDPSTPSVNGVFAVKPGGQELNLSQGQFNAAVSWKGDAQIGYLMADLELFFDASLKNSTEMQLRDWVKNVLTEQSSQPSGFDYTALTLGRDSVWGIDYSQAIESQQRGEALYSLCATEYQFPKSFQVSDRWAKQIDESMVWDSAGSSELIQKAKLSWFSSLIARPDSEYQPELWNKPAQGKPIRQILGAGKYQDLIDRNLLKIVNFFVEPCAEQEESDASGAVQSAFKEDALTSMREARYVFGLSPSARRELLRGPIQLATMVLCVWGLLFLLAVKIPLSILEFGYMPMSATYRGSETPKTWMHLWAMPTIDPKASSPIISEVYGEARSNRFLIPRITGAAFLAKKSGKTDSEVEQTGLAMIAEWKKEKEHENQFLELLMFALPNIGFLGTIIGLTRGLGIAYAIGIPSDDPFHKSAIIASMSTQLGTAFYTTLVALVCLIPLAFCTYWLQRTQDFIATKAEVTLRRLISKLV